MRFHLIDTLLVRAPLLPVRELSRAGECLLKAPLGPAAVALASRELGRAVAEGQAGGGVAGAVSRYGRRAAFRATPAGLLAGVGLARLGTRTAIATAAAQAHVRPAWARLAALARALLDEPALRHEARLRLCPSLVRGAGHWTWLGLGEEELTVRSLALDPGLAALVASASEWTPWPRVRRQVRAGFATLTGQAAGAHLDDEIDVWLLGLVDEGLLCHDLEPPLVGPPPFVSLTERLAALAKASAEAGALVAPVCVALDEVAAACAVPDVEAARAELGELPGAAPVDLHAVLSFATRGPATVSRAAVARAAELGPLLFALQEATAAPAAERWLDSGLRDRLYGVAEQYGAGTFPFAALAAGAYGVRLNETDDTPPSAPAMPPDLASYLVDEIAAAHRCGATEIALDPEVLQAILPPPALPPSFELFFTPAKEPPRAAPGTGWLLGHHGPAGASCGRYAEVLGPPITAALAELAVGEGTCRPGERAVDVVHAASLATADLSVHAPIRSAALALTGWPAGAALTPAALGVVIDEAAAEPLALVDGTGPIAPVPAHRVRSTTVPAGLYRLLAGWSFSRQHAPWSFSWGPLGGLAFLPRLTLAGFVIAPASWRLPDRETLNDRRAFARWRKAAAPPRLLVVGEGDELLPVDLDSQDARAELTRHAGGRAYEVWPPLDRLPDAGGRRIEVVATVLAAPADATAAAAIAATSATAAVGPVAATPAADWITWRIFGAREDQDELLVTVIAPAIAALRASGTLRQWHFLRYVERGSGRDHLRVRVQTAPRARARTQRELERALARARAAGLVTAIDTADYFPEVVRYGGRAAMTAAEATFTASSDFVLTALAAEDAGQLAPNCDRLALFVRAADALARGLGFDLEVRRALGERRRAAFARTLGPEDAAAKALFRERQRDLKQWLTADADRDARPRAPAVADAIAGPLQTLLARSSMATTALSAAARNALCAAAPALLHLQAVRLLGGEAEAERLGYMLWARALEGLAARRGRG